jgi:hypothetical protein
LRHSGRSFAFTAALALSAAVAFAADSPPLSGVWNIAPTGSAASSGELLFRVTAADGAEPVSVAVSVMSGQTELQVAREIRSRLAAQLPPDRFDVQLGEGANVLVTDRRNRPNFSLELVDSGVQNLRVAVGSVAPAASPTVREQELPAEPPNSAAPANTAPGDTVPPPASSLPPPSNTLPPPASSLPPPSNTPPPPASSLPPPSNTMPPPASSLPPPSNSIPPPASSIPPAPGAPAPSSKRPTVPKPAPPPTP